MQDQYKVKIKIQDKNNYGQIYEYKKTWIFSTSQFTDLVVLIFFTSWFTQPKIS